MAEPRAAPTNGTAGRRRTVEVSLEEREFAVLERLAACHGRFTADLLRKGLPRVIHQARREGAGARNRRSYVTGSSRKRHEFAPVRSQPDEEGDSG